MNAGKDEIRPSSYSRPPPEEYFEDFNLRKRSLLHAAVARARYQLVVTRAGYPVNEKQPVQGKYETELEDL